MIYNSHKDDFGARSYKTLDDLDLTVRDAIQTLRGHLGDFDAIIVTGVSGLVVAAPVALAIEKPLCIVRKSGESCHDVTQIVNEKRLAPRMLFLDDLVHSGATRRKVQAALGKFYEQEMEQWTVSGESFNDPKPVPSLMTCEYLYADDDYRELPNPSAAEFALWGTARTTTIDWSAVPSL